MDWIRQYWIKVFDNPPIDTYEETWRTDDVTPTLNSSSSAGIHDVTVKSSAADELLWTLL